MKNRQCKHGLISALAMTILVAPANVLLAEAPQFTDSFVPEKCEFISVGSNPFFILQPGYQQDYEGLEDGKKVHLTITVTNHTRLPQASLRSA